MVVLISGLSFLGYVAIQIAGERKGTIVTAVAGAMVSSTAITISMAQYANEQKGKTLFAGCVLLASTIMFLRVMIEVFVVYPGLLYPLWIPLSAMLAGLLCGLTWLWYRYEKGEAVYHRHIEVKNPLQLGMAMKFGLLLPTVLLLSEAMKEWFGNYGVYALSVVSGLMHVDAITLSLSRSAQHELAAEVATLNIVLACATNTLVKGVLFAVIAGFSRVLKNKNQAVRQGARRCDKRSIFKHM